jgi:hypothetical protein
VRNEAGGAVFTLTFPRADTAARPAAILLDTEPPVLS